MRFSHFPTHAVIIVALAAAAGQAEAQDESRTVANGGVHVAGWTGQIDPGEREDGYTLASARLAGTADSLHVTTGPAVTYWQPDNSLSGDYTVTATFREDEYMSLNSHPHPYGIVIAGRDLGTDARTLLYCAAYGDGRFIVRGFAPEPFQLNGRRGESHDAVNRAAGEGASVTQTIAVSVRDGRVACAINGAEVGSYDMGDVVADGRLNSTDGVYGLRFGHNTEAVVTGLTVTQH